MNETMFLGVAIFVFIMLAIGLGLTMLEFRHGEPRQQDKAARAEKRRSAADAPAGSQHNAA